MTVAMVKTLTVMMSLLATVTVLAVGQQLPSRNEDHVQFQLNNQEIFYDTHLIPDGSEVSSYIRKGNSSRFFFIVEEDNTPLAIHVAPCSSSITSHIRYQTKPEDYDAKKPDARDELLSQTVRDSTTRRRGREKRLLLTRTGPEAVKFQTELSPSGLYSVEIIALDRDTTVYMYATTTPDSDQLFPELPNDATVKVVSVNKNVVSIAWKPSPTDAQHSVPVEYCVSANRKQNFGRMCAALTSRYGDVPPTPPPNAGFGFPWEKKAAQRNAARRRVSPPTPKPPDRAAADQVFYACVGNKTSYSFSKMQTGATYYIDVFAVNIQTNRSSTYLGTNVSTSSVCPAQKTTNIARGKVYKIESKNNCGLQTAEHHLRRNVSALLIGIQSCSDERPTVNVTRGQSTAETDVVSDWPILKLSVADPALGAYRIRLSSTEQRKNVAFKMAVGWADDALPFPVLPSNRTIRVVEGETSSSSSSSLSPSSSPSPSSSSSSSCRSLTLMWNIATTDQPQQYCLYMERQRGAGGGGGGGGGKSTGRRSKTPATNTNTNRCAIGETLRRKANKVMCKTVAVSPEERGESGQRGERGQRSAVAEMVEVVSDLKPNTRYTFDVVVTKQGKESAAYDTLAVKTRKC